MIRLTVVESALGATVALGAAALVSCRLTVVESALGATEKIG